MNYNQKISQQDQPISLGAAHNDPREGLQTDERNARRAKNERAHSEHKIGDDEEE